MRRNSAQEVMSIRSPLTLTWSLQDQDKIILSFWQSKLINHAEPVVWHKISWVICVQRMRLGRTVQHPSKTTEMPVIQCEFFK